VVTLPRPPGSEALPSRIFRTGAGSPSGVAASLPGRRMVARMARAAPLLRPARALLLGLAVLSAVPVPARSQGRVVRDGTLGTGPLEVGPGQGATYLITPDMGEQRGGNLFHSFGRLGIGQGETATFTGPESV